MKIDLTRSHFNNNLLNDSPTVSKPSDFSNENSDEFNCKSYSNIKLKSSAQTITSSSASISSEEAIRLSGLVAKTRALFESNNSKYILHYYIFNLILLISKNKYFVCCYFRR